MNGNIILIELTLGGGAARNFDLVFPGVVVALRLLLAQLNDYR